MQKQLIRVNAEEGMLAAALDDRQFTLYLQAMANRLGFDMSSIEINGEEFRVSLEPNGVLAALNATLLFYSVGPWTAERMDGWIALTGTQDVTTKALCDCVRKALNGQ